MLNYNMLRYSNTWQHLGCWLSCSNISWHKDCRGGLHCGKHSIIYPKYCSC